MSSMSEYLEARDLNHFYNKVASSAPDTYLALYTSDPTDADTGTEVTGYTRPLIDQNGGIAPTWSTTSADGIGQKISNAHDIEVVVSAGAPVTITHVGIRDAVTAGNLLDHKDLDEAQIVNDGGTLRILAGNLEIRRE